MGQARGIPIICFNGSRAGSLRVPLLKTTLHRTRRIVRKIKEGEISHTRSGEDHERERVLSLSLSLSLSFLYTVLSLSMSCERMYMLTTPRVRVCTCASCLQFEQETPHERVPDRAL